MADNPQQTIRELKELVVAYAKQETVDPLKGLGRYVGFGVAGAVLIGTGIAFIAVGALRALQTQTGPHLTGHLTFLPYVIVIVGLFLMAGLVWMARGKRKKAKS